MIPNLTIGDLMIDCANAERARDFYVNLLGWESAVESDRPALITGNGMMILFAEPEIPYMPPVWPEEPGAQQKQMHLDFSVDDFPSAVEKAIRLGATTAAAQYGGEGFITMHDTEGHPFCLCKKRDNKSEKSEFDLYFEKMGYGAIPDISINIDCNKQSALRNFYAQITGWDQNFDSSALVADNGMIVCFQGCDNDATMDEYAPPVWPEQPGKQQKQMRFDFQTEDLRSAVAEAVGLGAVKPAAQYGDEHRVTLLDTDGHPFCLYTKVFDD